MSAVDTWTPLPIYQPETAGVEGLFDFGSPLGARPYTPVPLRWGPMCDDCWLGSDQAVRPESSAVCPHGGGGS